MRKNPDDTDKTNNFDDIVDFVPIQNNKDDFDIGTILDIIIEAEKETAKVVQKPIRKSMYTSCEAPKSNKNSVRNAKSSIANQSNRTAK